MRYLALGDSYTIGEAVDAGQRWPAQVAAKVEQATGNHFDEIRYIAQTGWTTDELEMAIQQETLCPPFDLVSLLIGVNNQYRGRTLEEYRDQFRQLLALALAMAGDNANRVIVVSIPDWGVTPFAKDRDRDEIARHIDDFNAAAHAICTSEDVAFIDITPISRLMGLEVVEDGLHPSGLQYRAWAEQIASQVAGLLASRSSA